MSIEEPAKAGPPPTKSQGANKGDPGCEAPGRSSTHPPNHPCILPQETKEGELRQEGIEKVGLPSTESNRTIKGRPGIHNYGGTKHSPQNLEQPGKGCSIIREYQEDER